MKFKYKVISIMIMGLLMVQCDQKKSFQDIALQPSLEDRSQQGDLYTPSTQSLLRTHSSLEKVNSLSLTVSKDRVGTFMLEDEESGKFLEIKNITMDYLVPRLHYWPGEPADEFDALNLMLAEYSRNSVSVPVGSAGDEMAHFQTNLNERVPWKLKGDYDFVPNPDYKPLRVSVVNNCLKPGLWELNAIDRSGEVYHSWFNMPDAYYHGLVAEVNGLESDFVKEALVWKEEHEVKLELDRLRAVKKDLGKVGVSLKDEGIGFSSQGSRRKLSRNFALIEKDGELVKPKAISDFHQYPARMSSFIEPGIYAISDEGRSPFDFSFLGTATSADIKLVSPKTKYNWQNERKSSREQEKQYLEFTINLANNEKLVIGNLPSHLLVKQEDFMIHGFGVGILHAAGFAERRDFLIEKGPCPSYAYLARKEGEDYYGVNSHGRGVEQIFIRSHPDADQPHWEVTITSYERIADLAKYIIPMPSEVINAQDKATKEYIPPIYFTYRDDNKN